MVPGELERLRPAIDEHFGKRDVAAIVASLERESRPEYRDWARETSEALARRSPTLLAVTFEQLRRGASMTLAECFRMELGLVAACFAQGDFLEGIRALLIDKDYRPRWRPNRLEEVTPAMVASFFAPHDSSRMRIP
jgi:enoyl-CoA hydratase/carnithine racemase